MEERIEGLEKQLLSYRQDLEAQAKHQTSIQELQALQNRYIEEFGDGRLIVLGKRIDQLSQSISECKKQETALMTEQLRNAELSEQFQTELERLSTQRRDREHDVNRLRELFERFGRHVSHWRSRRDELRHRRMRLEDDVIGIRQTIEEKRDAVRTAEQTLAQIVQSRDMLRQEIAAIQYRNFEGLPSDYLQNSVQAYQQLYSLKLDAYQKAMTESGLCYKYL